MISCATFARGEHGLTCCCVIGVLGYSVAFMDWGDWNPFGEVSLLFYHETFDGGMREVEHSMLIDRQARKWLKENGAPFVGANEGGRQRGPTIHRIGEENKDRG